MRHRRALLAAAALLSLLAFAPAAHAVKTVDRVLAGSNTPANPGSQFPEEFTLTGTTEGLFDNPKDIAVNHAGGYSAGGVDSDVYVVDMGNHRVQRFESDGTFVLMWGRGVRTGAAAFEVCTAAQAPCQAGTPGSGGGMFQTPQGIDVNQTTGDVYVRDSGNLRVQRFDADGNFISAFGWDVVASGPGQADERQAVTVNATSGAFTLTFAGETTAPIPFNAPASGLGSVQEALEALPNLEPGDLTVSGGPGGSGGTNPYVVQFSGAKADANLALMSADGSGLGGGSATISTGSGNSPVGQPR